MKPSLYEIIHGVMTNPKVELTNEEMNVLGSRPFKLLCEHIDQLYSLSEGHQTQITRLKREVGRLGDILRECEYENKL